MTAQFIAQYDGSSRAQFIAQYASAATTLGRTDDFDSAIGTVGTITNPTSLTPSVQVVPFNPGEVNGWLTVYVRVYGLNGKTPTFTLDFTNWRESYGLPSSTGWVMMWRYRDDSDPGTINPRDWTPFNNQSGDPTITFSNNAAFSQDEIEIAVKPRWRYVDTQRAFAYAALSSYASQLGSANSNHVFNTVTLTSGADNSATPTTLNQYGILLDNTASQPAGGEDKLNVIILLSQHSSEDQGNYYGWRLIEHYLDGVGATFDWFRQHCRLYVYDVNPAGRYYGAERWTQEQASDEDSNRSWDDSNSEQVNAAKTAISTDISRTDVLLDFHGSWRLGNTFSQHYGIYTTTTAATNFTTRFNAASSYSLGVLGSSVTAGTASDYGNTTLSAQLSFTAEFGMNGQDSPTDMWADADVIMLDYIEALEAMVDNSELTLTSLSSTVSADTQLPYNIRELVAAEAQFLYNVRELVTQEHELLYSIAETVGSDTSLPYNIAELVSSDTQLLANIRELVSSDTQLLYDIVSLSVVGNSLQLLYNIAENVGTDTAIPYNIRETVSVDTQLLSNIRELVSADTSLPYNLRELAGSSVQIIYDILQTGTVGSSVQLPYNIREHVSADHQLPFNILVAVSQDVELLYRILNTVSADTQLPYSIAELARADVELRYNILADTVIRQLKEDGGIRLLRILHENRLVQVEHENTLILMDQNIH